MKSFKDKIVVITGAGSGIGRALALAFGRLGAWIGINDVDRNTLQETVTLLQAEGVQQVYASSFDVTDNEHMQQFGQDIRSVWGNAHVIINNAGIEGGSAPATDLPEEMYRRVMEVNFFSVVNGCKTFIPQLVENNEGAVVNISSIFGLVGMMNYSDYSASKFAVRGYTEALMAELHHSPISIHCVHPGGIKTNIAKNSSSRELAEKNLRTPPEDLARFIVKSIKKKRARIVYGHGAFKVWLGARIMSQSLLKGLIWRQVQGQ